MSNPFQGFLIGGSYFNYVDGSYSRTQDLRNTTVETQSSRTSMSQGIALPKHSVSLLCENTYYEVDPVTNNQGSQVTTKGVSRLAFLLSLLGATANLPLIVMVPDGTTHRVIPTGTIDISMFPSQPSDTGVEYRVSLTFEDIP